MDREFVNDQVFAVVVGDDAGVVCTVTASDAGQEQSAVGEDLQWRGARLSNRVLQIQQPPVNLPLSTWLRHADGVTRQTHVFAACYNHFATK